LRWKSNAACDKDQEELCEELGALHVKLTAALFDQNEKRFLVTSMTSACCWCLLVAVSLSVIDDADAGAASSSNNKATEPRNVLVLGSTGLIGNSLVQYLVAAGHNVFSTDVHEPLKKLPGYKTLDLRTPGALDAFGSNKIHFVYFLACDVGGSK